MGVEPGRLVVQGTERRAFGEYVSQRGELASYAFGWDSGDESGFGRLTIGIGAGNEGGGTFHVRVWIDEDDGWAMGLVDEPFEDVPEGGPDLTADQARAHEDSPFVWWVADFEDRTLMDVLDLPPGQGAVRDGVGGRWTRRPEESFPSSG
jgi:hypothetical protein